MQKTEKQIGCDLPYNHAGRYKKTIDSIWAPGSKVTFIQHITEMQIWCLSRWLEPFKSIKKGEGWSTGCSKQVRNISQQASVIANYFPFHEDDPLIIIAFRNFFKKHKPNSIGGYRKYRKNITKAEKDTVKAIQFEYDLLKKQQEVIKMNDIVVETPTEATTFRKNVGTNKLAKLR